MPTGQLYPLQDHFGGSEKIRYQCEQDILLRNRQRLSRRLRSGEAWTAGRRLMSSHLAS